MATLQYKSTVNQSRLAVLGMFFINGALMATWISRIPQIQDKLGLSEGQLGIVLHAIAHGIGTALFGERQVRHCTGLVGLRLVESFGEDVVDVQ